MLKKSKQFLSSQANRTKKNVESVKQQAQFNLRRHVIRRWRKFAEVRRFVIGWSMLIFLLVLGVFFQLTRLEAFYKQEVPAPGGTYIEGVVGEVKNLNPIFATSAPDRAAAYLLFDTLLKYNKNNQLVGSLAKSWEVSSDETEYTVTLRDDIYWHDGKPITSKDVRFTIEAIQHPDTRSPLSSSWRDVEVKVKDDKTVIFKLPNPFTPFIHSLVISILPEHILVGTPHTDLRAHSFNLAPKVASGPFVFDEILLTEGGTQIFLEKNDNYYLGTPKLDEFIINAFSSNDQLLDAISKKDITGASGLPIALSDATNIHESYNNYDLPLFSNVFVFLNNERELLKSTSMRKALVQATDRNAINKKLGNRYPLSESPLLDSQLGYNPNITQLKFNQKAASEQLDKLGWKLRDDGFRYKNNKKLEFTLVTQDSDEYPIVAAEVQRQWRQVGVLVNPVLVPTDELQQSYLFPHNYDLLLLGVSVGVDPDQFVYWHSSQAVVGGFNFSNYKNLLVDTVLESARTKRDPKLRAAKYKTFLEQWRKDAPAISLYQPVFSYIQIRDAAGFEPKDLNDPVDRFYDVVKWTVNTQIVNKPI